MTQAIHGRALGRELIARGLCPSNATRVKLWIPVDGAVMLRYDVIVDVADLSKIADALTAVAATGKDDR